MKITKENIGELISIKSSSTTAKILDFNQGPKHTDVDLELPDGEIMNTFDCNITRPDVIDVAKYKLKRVISKSLSKAA